MLKMYGEAESTLSISTLTVDPVATGLLAGAAAFGSLMTYLNVVVVGTSVMKYDPLNLSATAPDTPSICTGVPLEKP
jgi:hypothetical protein